VPKAIKDSGLTATKFVLQTLQTRDFSVEKLSMGEEQGISGNSKTD